MSNPWNESGKPSDNNPWDQPGSNPWAPPQDAAPPTMGWGAADSHPPQESTKSTQDLGSPVITPSVPSKRNRVGGFLVGLIVVLALAIIGAVVWLFLSGQLGGADQNDSDSSEVAVVQTTETATGESSGAGFDNAGSSENPDASASPQAPSPTVDDTDEALNNSQSASARSVERRTSAPPVTPALPAAAQQAGLTPSGWSDNTATRCSGAENLVYAGRDSDAWITVCKSGSQMIYRSDIFGGAFSASVDQARSNPDQGEFYIDASPSIIKVVGGGVEVFEGSALIAEKNLPSAWVLN